MSVPLAAILRVRNESRWIKEVIEGCLRATPYVLVFDDNSTDDTLAIAAKAGAMVIPSPFREEPRVIDEARDKDWVLLCARELWNPDWVLMVDGDEVLMGADLDTLREAIAPEQDDVDAWSFQIVYLWDRPDQIRVDGIYGDFFRPSLFRARGSTLLFRRTPYGGNFHCSSVPADRILGHVRLPVRLKHYGYIDREQRIAKWHWYNSIDPRNEFEDCYRHMVLGDVDELPASAKLKHAGPLRLAPWT